MRICVAYDIFKCQTKEPAIRPSIQKLSRVSVDEKISPEFGATLLTLILAFCRVGMFGAPTSVNTK